MLPWVNCWAAVTTRTPSPEVELLRFTAPDAYTSANSAWESLNPTVLALAMLVEVMSSAVLAADKPDKAMLKLLDMRVLLNELVRYLLDAAERHAAGSCDVQSKPRGAGGIGEPSTGA